MNLFNVIGDVLYFVYDTTILGCISIIFPFESIENKMTLHNLCRNKCNKCCNDICYDISWKTVQIITVVQLFHKKTVTPAFHKMTNNYFRNINEIVLIKDGEEIRQFKTWELFELGKETEVMEFDLVLYTKYSESESKKNYTVIGDRSLKKSDHLFTSKCQSNFIIFQLIVDENKYDINLKEPQNFFIKDNTIRYTFFKWYMKKVYDIELSEVFSVNYMTQDMSIATLHNPFYIKFNEDGITSFSTGKPKPKPPCTNINIPSLFSLEERTNDITVIKTEPKIDDIDSLYINIINSERLKEHCE